MPEGQKIELINDNEIEKIEDKGSINEKEKRINKHLKWLEN